MIMKLRYISMELSYRDNYDDKYAYAFYCHTRFISNYLSKAIRKDRYETHKDYNAIFIEVGSEHDSFIGGPECLFVFVPFYKERYERSIEIQDVSYYLELFNQGLRKASMYDDIPWCVFETALRSFEMNGCRNEWIYKKTIFREINLKVEMHCELTTNDFGLRILFFDFKQKKLLCKGVALATEANELHYEHLFRGIKLIEDSIGIFDFTNRIFVYFNIEDIKNGVFRIQYQDYDADRNSSIKGYYDSYIEAIKRALVKNDALDNRL